MPDNGHRRWTIIRIPEIVVPNAAIPSAPVDMMRSGTASPAAIMRRGRRPRTEPAAMRRRRMPNCRSVFPWRGQRTPSAGLCTQPAGNTRPRTFGHARTRHHQTRRFGLSQRHVSDSWRKPRTAGKIAVRRTAACRRRRSLRHQDRDNQADNHLHLARQSPRPCPQPDHPSSTGHHDVFAIHTCIIA